MEKVKVNKDLCIRCGACVSIAPDVFQFGNDDCAEVKVDSILETQKEDVMDALEGCPTSAIYEEN